MKVNLNFGEKKFKNMLTKNLDFTIIYTGTFY